MPRCLKSAIRLAMVLALTGTACSTAMKVETGAAEAACFNVRDVRSAEPLHDRFVLVRCSHEREFLLTVGGPCLGLSRAIRVAVSNDFNRVCSHDGAKLTFREFDVVRRCEILEVEAVNDETEARDLVAARTASNGD